MSVDLAASKPSLHRDYTVFQLWGFDKETHHRIILNQLRRQTADPTEIEKALKEWVQSYQPHILLVEANMVDKLYARKLEEVIGFPVKIVELKKNKEDDFSAFRDLIQSGFALIPWAHDNIGTRHTFASFLDEMHNWPDTQHDDTLDAASHAYTEMKSSHGEMKARILNPKSPEGATQATEEGLEITVSRESLVRSLKRGGKKEPEVRGQAVADLLNSREQQKRSEQEVGDSRPKDHPARQYHGQRTH